jgi:hypothetical protein
MLLVFDSWFYAVAFLGQSAFYSVAILGWLQKITTDHALVKIPFYFLTVNAAILVAVPQGKPNGYVDTFTALEKASFVF